MALHVALLQKVPAFPLKWFGAVCKVYFDVEDSITILHLILVVMTPLSSAVKTSIEQVSVQVHRVLVTQATEFD